MSLKRFRTLAIVTLALLAAPAFAQSADDDARFRAAQERFDREFQIFRDAYDRYQAQRRLPGGVRGDQRYDDRRAPPRLPDPAYDDGAWRDERGYDPARDYRGDSRYQERVLNSDERVYSGYDGRYYCRRGDGTTGLIVGGAAGGILGNVIDGGRSRIVGTLLGGAAGAPAGRAVDQNQQVRCR